MRTLYILPYLCWVLALTPSLGAQSLLPKLESGALNGERFRVVVSSDIGGTDPDDFQSMVHLLLYSDVLDLEGMISSPYGPGRKSHILQVIDCYERDYSHLASHSKDYPDPTLLRDISKQGHTDEAPYVGFSKTSEGSNWIVHCARKQDVRPLYVLVWGGLEDLAQALHDAPEILPKLRVYWIGGPNKKWSVNAYQYLVNQHSQLFFIEANETYRGWFVGGNQQCNWNNAAFVRECVDGHGTLGDFFAKQLGGVIKMGDTPSLAWLLKGDPRDPTKPSWGGQFVRAWKRPHLKLNRLPSEEDEVEVFGVLELELPLPPARNADTQVKMQVENQTLLGNIEGDIVRFRFCPKAAKSYQLKFSSNLVQFDNQQAAISAKLPIAQEVVGKPWDVPSWWTDNPAPELAEGTIMGAKTVSQFREQFLGDFAERLQRCRPEKELPSKSK